MSRPLPAAPRRFDLVESFDALALAGKKPNVDRRISDAPGPMGQRGCTFSGGLVPGLLVSSATLDNHRHPPVAHHNARVSPSVLPSNPAALTIPIPRTGKQSLTMQYALESPLPSTSTKPMLSPPFVAAPPRPHSDSIISPKLAPRPPLSAVTRATRPALDVVPVRTRSASVPLSPATSSSGKGTAQCSGVTKAGKQCSRQVRLPAAHSLLDPTPVLYCHQHKEAIFTQAGFYVRKPGSADRFVEFSDYIPGYLQMDTQLALKIEMEKATSLADTPGYIYTFEIRDPKQPDVIQLKVGRAVNLAKRLDQWDKQCGSKVQIPRGWWPGTVDDGVAGSLLKGNIKAGDPGPFCHRVERLVHIELADLSFHAPYLKPSWPNIALDPTPGTTNPSKKSAVREIKCLDCGAVHKEIFSFRRPERGQYKGKEWDLIVKPVIEKWGRFVKEHYA